jgi:hypothetical protein
VLNRFGAEELRHRNSYSPLQGSDGYSEGFALLIIGPYAACQL